MDCAVRSHDTRLNFWFGLMPSLPATASLGPVLHSLLILDAVNKMASLHESAGFVELKLKFVEKNRSIGMFGGLDAFGCVAQRCGVGGKGWSAPDVSCSCLARKKEESD